MTIFQQSGGILSRIKDKLSELLDSQQNRPTIHRIYQKGCVIDVKEIRPINNDEYDYYVDLDGNIPSGNQLISFERNGEEWVVYGLCGPTLNGEFKMGVMKKDKFLKEYTNK